MANEMKWQNGSVRPQPGDDNNIYWCDVSNAAVVMPHHNNVCPLCSQTLVDMPNKHTFVAHITKER
jgi:hypothetical protein